MKIFVFLFGVSLSVMHLCDDLETVSTPLNVDDVNYSQLLSDTTISELLENFDPSRNYSKFFHLDVLYGFHYNFKDFWYYWANAFRRHFTFGQSYLDWHRSSIISIGKNQIDPNSMSSLWEYFNFMQSFWASSSFGLFPTWTWQIKNSNWFFSIGGIVEWSSYNYSYSFISCKKSQFLMFGDQHINEAFKNNKNSVILNTVYNSDQYRINSNVFNKSSRNKYQIICYDNDIPDNSYPCHLYDDVIFTSDKKEQNTNGIKSINAVGDDDTKALLFDDGIEIKYQDDNSKEQTKYITVTRSKNDTYDEQKLNHNDNNKTYYVCDNDDSAATCSILTNILRIGVVGNISWHKNKIDPLASWHFGISFGFGPQFGYSNNGDFSFYRWHTRSFYNISIKRFLDNQFVRFDENIYEESLILKPVFFFVQVEVAYKRIAFWIRFYPPFFTDGHKKNGYPYKIVPDNNSWAKYKDFSYPMTAPEENNQNTIDSRISKTAFFSRYGFACGVKIIF